MQYNLDPLDPAPSLEDYEDWQEWQKLFKELTSPGPFSPAIKRSLFSRVDHLRRAYFALKNSQADTQPLEPVQDE